MKKVFIKTFLSLAMILGAACAIHTVDAQVVEAPVVADAGVRDMSKAAMEGAGKTYTRWEAKNGDFVSVDDWMYSGKGFSFEFQFQNPDDKKQSVVAFRSHGTNIACGTSSDYLIRISSGNLSSDIGRLSLIDSTNGWYKFEVMFAELGERLLTAADGHKTLDEMFFSWGAPNYINDLNVRNMQVICPEQSLYVNNATKSIWANNYSGANQNGRFISYKNWFNSGKGFFMDFKMDGTVQLHGNLMGTTSDKTINKSAISAVKYLVNGGSAVGGRLHNLGDGWYRYDTMFSVFTPSSETAKGAAVQGFNFQWGATYAPSKIQAFGIIDALSFMVTKVVDGNSSREFVTTAKYAKPADPTAPAGKRFVGWYTDSTFANPYNFDADLTADITLHAKFEDCGTALFELCNTLKSLWMSYTKVAEVYSDIVASLRFGIRFDYSTFKLIDAQKGEDDVTYGVSISKDDKATWSTTTTVCPIIAFLDADGNETSVEDDKVYAQFSYVIDNMPNTLYNEVLYAKAYVKVGSSYCYSQESSGSVVSVAQYYIDNYSSDPKVAPHLGALQALVATYGE